MFWYFDIWLSGNVRKYYKNNFSEKALSFRFQGINIQETHKFAPKKSENLLQLNFFFKIVWIHYLASVRIPNICLGFFSHFLSRQRQLKHTRTKWFEKCFVLFIKRGRGLWLLLRDKIVYFLVLFFIFLGQHKPDRVHMIRRDQIKLYSCIQHTPALNIIKFEMK